MVRQARISVRSGVTPLFSARHSFSQQKEQTSTSAKMLVAVVPIYQHQQAELIFRVAVISHQMQRYLCEQEHIPIAQWVSLRQLRHSQFIFRLKRLLAFAHK